jgi:trimethylamine:corrinoid methyltransferase-like protein
LEVWKPKLARRQGLISGQPEGSTTLERARAEAKRIIENHMVEPLADPIQMEIDAILREYNSKHIEN